MRFQKCMGTLGGHIGLFILSTGGAWDPWWAVLWLSFIYILLSIKRVHQKLKAGQKWSPYDIQNIYIDAHEPHELCEQLGHSFSDQLIVMKIHYHNYQSASWICLSLHHHCVCVTRTVGEILTGILNF